MHIFEQVLSYTMPCIFVVRSIAQLKKLEVHISTFAINKSSESMCVHANNAQNIDINSQSTDISS